ncbi:uncharacterized protein LOC144573617 [Carex rostrata]
MEPSIWDKFTDECAQFQATVIESIKEMASLVEEKEALQKEMLNLELKLNTLQNSTTDYIAEILQEIYRSCSVLEADLKHGIANYKCVLEDIHNLKIIFANTIEHQGYMNSMGSWNKCFVTSEEELLPACMIAHAYDDMSIISKKRK